MYVAEGGLVLYSDKKLEMQLLPDCNGPTTTTFFMLAAINNLQFTCLSAHELFCKHCSRLHRFRSRCRRGALGGAFASCCTLQNSSKVAKLPISKTKLEKRRIAAESLGTSALPFSDSHKADFRF
jgi:hypothetical protein